MGTNPASIKTIDDVRTYLDKYLHAVRALADVELIFLREAAGYARDVISWWIIYERGCDPSAEQRVIAALRLYLQARHDAAA